MSLASLSSLGLLLSIPGFAASLPAASDPSLFEGFYPDSDQILDAGSPQCRFEALRAIGWNVSFDKSLNSVKLTGENVCEDKSLAESQLQGDLQIKIKDLGGLTEAEYLKILDRSASLCGFKLKLESAAVSATQLLRRNKNLTFGATKFHFMVVPETAPWVTTCLRGECFSPSSTPSNSLDYLLRRAGQMRMECAAGVQTMKYALIRELYGEKLLDESFNQDEFMIGTWGKVNYSNSAVFGKSSGERPADELAIKTSKIGRVGLVGVAGYLGNLKGEAFLDSPNDRGENFMIVNVTNEANQSLVDDNGLSRANLLATELWELSKSIRKGDLKEFVTSSSPDLSRLGNRRRENILRMREILSYPVFTGIMVQVHPLGLMNLGRHLTRLLSINPRTPYEIKIYADHVNAGLFRRYVNDTYKSCLKNTTAERNSNN